MKILKHRVITLREKGYTYPQIRKSLKIATSNSTLSYWCKGVTLPKSYMSKLARINDLNRAKGRQVIATKRQIEKNQFLKNVGILNKNLFLKFSKDMDIKKIALAVLYLGEGSKWKGHRGLMLGSSNQNIIRLYINLLSDIYSVPKSSLRARISYRADQSISNITNFWSKGLGISKKQFYKTKPDPRTVGKQTKNTDYKGVCVITCAGTNIQLELETISKIICNMGR